MEEESHCFIALSNLICEEENDAYVETLVSRETAFDCTASVAISVFARSECVAWVLRMKARFRLGYRTAYLAVTYLDRFFLRLTIDEGKTWAVKLLSIACLSLAAKMEECTPPALSEYAIDEYQFSSNAIQRMELLVLNTLEWRMSPVTPFAYLGYFASKFCCDEEPTDFRSRAAGFVLTTIKARTSLDYRPSTVALAAVLAAAGDQLTKKSVEVKMRLISSLSESLESEHVFSCYTLMIRDVLSSESSTDFGSVIDCIRPLSPEIQ